MSGVDQLLLFIDGKLPAPPLTNLSGLVVDEASIGACTWSIPASPWSQTAAGVFAGGTLGFVADAALAGAVFTTLPKGMRCCRPISRSTSSRPPRRPASDRWHAGL